MATRIPFAHYCQAVDLARGFTNAWTHGSNLSEVEEWARQLREELNDALAYLDDPYGTGGEQFGAPGMMGG